MITESLQDILNWWSVPLFIADFVHIFMVLHIIINFAHETDLFGNG